MVAGATGEMLSAIALEAVLRRLVAIAKSVCKNLNCDAIDDCAQSS